MVSSVQILKGKGESTVEPIYTDNEETERSVRIREGTTTGVRIKVVTTMTPLL